MDKKLFNTVFIFWNIYLEIKKMWQSYFYFTLTTVALGIWTLLLALFRCQIAVCNEVVRNTSTWLGLLPPVRWSSQRSWWPACPRCRWFPLQREPSGSCPHRLHRRLLPEWWLLRAFSPCPQSLTSAGEILCSEQMEIRWLILNGCSCLDWVGN